MSTSEKSYFQARRRAGGALHAIGGEIRDARITAGLSQATVAGAARMSAAKVSRIEAGKLLTLSVADAVVLSDTVGLDLSVKAYPGRKPTRDAGQARRIGALLRHAAVPLGYRLEEPLPSRSSGPPERRAWDALLFDDQGATGLEMEQRLYDMQAQTRRIFLKWQDSGVERLLIVVADTRGNRRVLAEFPEYLSQIPHLKTRLVLSDLERGIRPPTGWMLF